MILLSELLKQAAFFSGISSKSRELLADICLPKSLRKKETLFSEGDTGHAVYICGRGAIQLSKFNAQGKETVIKIIEAGELFGEVILFEHNSYPVTATALSKSLVYILPKRDFYGLLGQEAFRNDFIRMLMKKQRYLAEQIHNLSTLTAEERLLVFLQNRSGQGKGDTSPLSKKDIASAIGANPETLSRILTNLTKNGLIEQNGKHIFIKSV